MQKLRNDKERRDYIQNQANWETVGTLNNLIRMRTLTYKSETWYTLEIMQMFQHYNIKAGAMEWVSEWRRLGIYQLNVDHRAFTYGVSVTEIINRIKEIDKEEKQK